jgi:hypothetical protein
MIIIMSMSMSRNIWRNAIRIRAAMREPAQA